MEGFFISLASGYSLHHLHTRRFHGVLALRAALVGVVCSVVPLLSLSLAHLRCALASLAYFHVLTYYLLLITYYPFTS
jgi:hypothetical protein